MVQVDPPDMISVVNVSLHEQIKTTKTSFRCAQADKYLLFVLGPTIYESCGNLGRLVRNKFRCRSKFYMRIYNSTDFFSYSYHCVYSQM